MQTKRESMILRSSCAQHDMKYELWLLPKNQKSREMYML
jgi:hypothetical protein